MSVRNEVDVVAIVTRVTTAVKESRINSRNRTMRIDVEGVIIIMMMIVDVFLVIIVLCFFRFVESTFSVAAVANFGRGVIGELVDVGWIGLNVTSRNDTGLGRRNSEPVEFGNAESSEKSASMHLSFTSFKKLSSSHEHDIQATCWSWA